MATWGNLQKVNHHRLLLLKCPTLQKGCYSLVQKVWSPAPLLYLQTHVIKGHFSSLPLQPSSKLKCHGPSCCQMQTSCKPPFLKATTLPLLLPSNPNDLSLLFPVLLCSICPFWHIPILCHHTRFSHWPCSPPVFLSAVNQVLDKDFGVTLQTLCPVFRSTEQREHENYIDLPVNLVYLCIFKYFAHAHLSQCQAHFTYNSPL